MAIKRASMKREKKAEAYKYFILFSIIVIFIILLIVFVSRKSWVSTVAFDQKITSLEDWVFSDNSMQNNLEQSISGTSNSKYVVFISLCDRLTRATVISGSGDSLQAAWNRTIDLSRTYIKKNSFDAEWIKVDIVNKMEKIETTDLESKIKPYYNEFFRQGISFDDSFSTAFLEAEINGNKLIDYKSDALDIVEINEYLDYYNRPKLKRLPDELILFTSQGYIYDNGTVYKLYDEGLNYGRRIVDEVNQEVVGEVISTASMFLSNLVQDNGKFIYGYYPTYDKEFQDYNILRHAGTIWSLITQYNMTKEEALIPKIDGTINYLIEGFVEYRNENTAFIIERKSDEIKLGGNAVAIIALIDYMDEFQTDKHKDLAIKLGNGILELLDMETGKYYHVLNFPSYSKKEEYRTIYYDGEATFALSKLYGLTGDEKWLDAAKAAVENFIKEDYTQYRDHWVAYAMNEITKYAPEEKYFEFALKNVQLNLDRIYHQQTSYHTYLELLMISFELYDRMVEQNIKIAYLDEFDEAYFINTIFHRADHMLNGYFYPEYAMYLKNPDRIIGTFFVRHDGYRIRIDDVQHFVGGYYYYNKYYDKLTTYRDDIKQE